jgi:site-specific DNA-methyltransferase (adenine-specific)
MKIIMKTVEELIPYINNPRKINANAVDKVASSIKNFGFKVPIIIDKNNEIVTGHTRLLGAKKLKLKEVPCLVADDLTEAQIKAFRIADNKVAEYSEWDEDLLSIEFDTLTDMDFDLELTAFDLDEINKDEDIEVVEDDFDTDEALNEIVEPITKRGDVWQLGKHRLMCGDSTVVTDVEKLMDGKKADMVFTDPPYLIETEGGCKGNVGGALKKQGKEIDFISNFNPKDFLNILPLTFDKGKINAYVFCNKELLPDYLMWAREMKYSFNVLIWKKPNAIPIGDSHRPDIEYLILFRKSAIWNNALKDVNYSRCLEYGREKGLHPTMKPIELIANEVKISSNANNVILDLFGGSGSTLIACEQTNRICYMMELDEKYCDVIIKRWETLTGNKAVLL